MRTPLSVREPVCEGRSITVTATPTLLKDLLPGNEFSPSVTRVLIQNTHASAKMYWALDQESPSAVANMGVIPAGQILELEWSAVWMNKLWVAGDGSQPGYVLQEG